MKIEPISYRVTNYFENGIYGVAVAAILSIIFYRRHVGGVLRRKKTVVRANTAIDTVKRYCQQESMSSSLFSDLRILTLCVSALRMPPIWRHRIVLSHCIS